MQARLREEIQSNIPYSISSTPDFDLAAILESMPLLNAICSESLRLYPTVPLTLRIPTQDTIILNQLVPKDTQIFLVPWAINRSPQIWGQDAEEFKPDRWINEDTGKPNNTGGASSNYSTLTFLHGPRSCIGQGFAKAELRALVATFVGAFEMELANPNEPVIPAGMVTIKPRNGLKLKVKEIGKW